MKPTQEQIQKLLDRGIAPGAMVISAQAFDTPPQLVRPTEEWRIYADEVNNGDGYYLTYNGSFAKVITPAPQAEGLKEGDTVECGPAMRAAIIELAKELGTPVYGVPYDNPGIIALRVGDFGLGLGTTTISVSPVRPMHPEAFIAKMRVTAVQPKPITIGDHTAEFLADGSIKVGCTVIDSEAMDRIIEQRAKTKQP